MATFNWSINGMTVIPSEGSLTDVVISASWTCNAISENGAANAYGSTSFTYTGGEFTPYQDLTQEQVLGWVFSSPGFSKDQQEADLIVLINARVNAEKTTPPLPWQTSKI